MGFRTWINKEGEQEEEYFFRPSEDCGTDGCKGQFTTVVRDDEGHQYKQCDRCGRLIGWR